MKARNETISTSVAGAIPASPGSRDERGVFTKRDSDQTRGDSKTMIESYSERRELYPATRRGRGMVSPGWEVLRTGMHRCPLHDGNCHPELARDRGSRTLPFIPRNEQSW
jgi:hypothetical protein